MDVQLGTQSAVQMQWSISYMVSLYLSIALQKQSRDFWQYVKATMQYSRPPPKSTLPLHRSPNMRSMWPF